MILSVGAHGKRPLVQLVQARQYFFRKERQVCDRLLMRQVAALAHHQKMAETAGQIIESCDLVIHLIRGAGEDAAGIDEVPHRGRLLVDQPAVRRLQRPIAGVGAGADLAAGGGAGAIFAGEIVPHSSARFA